VLDLETLDDGTFSASVKPGTYQIYGLSPQYNGGDGLCEPEDRTVTVTAGDRVVVDVLCQMKYCATRSLSPSSDLDPPRRFMTVGTGSTIRPCWRPDSRRLDITYRSAFPG
jgi:hypothetical protein